MYGIAVRMDLPATMPALRVARTAPDFAGCVLEDVPLPLPGAGEALVEIAAAGVNFPDLLMTAGTYQFRPDLPFTLGMEGSGIVRAADAGVDAALVGQPVVFGGKTGAFAPFGCFPAAALRPVPAGLGMAEAAACSATYLTARVTLVRRAAAQPGETLLVLGAAGGVGLATVDLAIAMGLDVIAAASTAAKRAALARLHPHALVIDSAAGFHARVLEETDGRGADIIVDPVGGDAFDEATRCIAFNGRLCTLGFTSGRIPTLAVNRALIEGFSLVGVRAGEYARRIPAHGEEDRGAIDAMIAAGTLRPHVHAALPLARWREAFGMIERREVVGKLVLLPGAGDG
jgi:NADPH:quinone reductase